MTTIIKKYTPVTKDRNPARATPVKIPPSNSENSLVLKLKTSLTSSLVEYGTG